MATLSREAWLDRQREIGARSTGLADLDLHGLRGACMELLDMVRWAGELLTEAGNAG